MSIRTGLIGFLAIWIVVAFMLGLLSPGKSAEFVLLHVTAAASIFAVRYLWNRVQR